MLLSQMSLKTGPTERELAWSLRPKPSQGCQMSCTDAGCCEPEAGWAAIRKLSVLAGELVATLRGAE
jgi:hypothetical protein